MSEWTDRLASEQRTITARIASTKQFYSQWAPLLEKYRCGMHSGFLAAIAMWESGGRANAVGDTSLGEVGFFQITDSTPREFGLPTSIRDTPEGNIFLGALEYNVAAVKLYVQFPDLFTLGSLDNWLMSRLTFAIGYGGTKGMIEKSGATRGNVYNACINYMNQTGGYSLGSQSAGKVWLRVHMVDVLHRVGLGVVGSNFRLPGKVAAPGGLRYSIPSGLVGLLADYGTLGFLKSIGGLGALLYLLGR